MTKQVVLIRGDGTGPELVKAMLTVLDAAEPAVKLVECDAGAEWWQAHGGDSLIPPATWQALEAVDACLKGPTTTLTDPQTPRSVAVSIRQRFNLYANVRPIRSLPGRPRPLGDVDFICVREGTEGLYSGIEYQLTNDVAIAIRRVTRMASERVARYAFRLAQERGWRTVVAVSKANILKITDGVFLTAVRRVATEYPGIDVEEYFIDNLAQQLVKNPQRFNQKVLLSTNLFMDILSEEASALVASIGAVYSGNFGDKFAMFEPAHGSTPKYAGQNKVNPTATILAAAWMLEYLGERDRGRAVFDATYDVIREGKEVTYDLGGNAGTAEMAQAVAARVRRLVKR